MGRLGVRAHIDHVGPPEARALSFGERDEARENACMTRDLFHDEGSI